MSLSLKQARRMTAKSRQRLYRVARTIIKPSTLAEWRAYPMKDGNRPYTRNEQVWKLCCGWLPRYTRTEAQRTVLRHALNEFSARRLRELRMEAPQ